jgi:cytoplasmic iron level regulating protein YaaA (DUF328/UPF0246 family)
MILLLNSSKTMADDKALAGRRYSLPEFLPLAEGLMATLLKLSEDQVAALMKVSPKLAAKTVQRHLRWPGSFSPTNACQALAAFRGDVYAGMAVEAYGESEFDFAQSRLRILSGLYGILRPLDLVRPYRLEMAYPLKTAAAKDLYGYWGERISGALGALLVQEGSGVVVNLASVEYGRAARLNRLGARIVTPVFREASGGRQRTVTLYTKRARGLMADFIIRHRIRDPRDLVDFNAEGYRFDPTGSPDAEWVFLRQPI